MKPDLAKKMVFVDVETATTPKAGIFRIIVDAWWAVTDEKIMLYRGQLPQCHMDKEMAEQINEKLYPECETRQLPAVYLPWKDHR